MREVTAICKAHPKYSIARRKQCQVDGGIRLRPRMGLYIGIIGTKERFCSFNGQDFYFINVFASTVLALMRIPLSIFVG